MEQLKKLRKEKGVLQKDVVAYLGIDRTTYVKYENGASEPDNETLIKIADYYGVTTDFLLGRENVTIVPPMPDEADIKVALFGGDGEVTDEMWDEVKRFAEFVKQNKGKK